MSRRGLPACLAFLLALAALLAPVNILAQDQAAPPVSQERQDTVLGTGGDTTSISRDPATGDTVLRATPQEQPREQYAPPQVTVQPEITLPAHKPKQGN